MSPLGPADACTMQADPCHTHTLTGGAGDGGGLTNSARLRLECRGVRKAGQLTSCFGLAPFGHSVCSRSHHCSRQSPFLPRAAPTSQRVSPLRLGSWVALPYAYSLRYARHGSLLRRSIQATPNATRKPRGGAAGATPPCGGSGARARAEHR